MSVIEKGRTVWQGTPADLDAAPEVAHRFLGV
jgi:branched-chain amino acid transport system ATP-binding protein